MMVLGAAAVKKLAAQGLAVAFHQLDVTNDKSIAALAGFTKDAHGRLDVLINNAGIIAKGEAPALNVALATIRTTLETNALGPLHVVQALAPFLKSSKSARIVKRRGNRRVTFAYPLITGDFSVFRRESQSHLGRSSCPAKASRSASSGGAAEQQVKLVALPATRKRPASSKACWLSPFSAPA
jgi:NAD(P)-dependent dehydrogenase (short-subunit alcohol dehydrogenase family)